MRRIIKTTSSTLGYFQTFLAVTLRAPTLECVYVHVYVTEREKSVRRRKDLFFPCSFVLGSVELGNVVSFGLFLHSEN